VAVDSRPRAVAQGRPQRRAPAQIGIAQSPGGRKRLCLPAAVLEKLAGLPWAVRAVSCAEANPRGCPLSTSRAAVSFRKGKAPQSRSYLAGLLGRGTFFAKVLETFPVHLTGITRAGSRQFRLPCHRTFREMPNRVRSICPAFGYACGNRPCAPLGISDGQGCPRFAPSKEGAARSAERQLRSAKARN
jgi:hypothetical protein